jgi:hypothetical protein
MRLLTSAIRGLALAQDLISGKDELEKSVDLLSRLLERSHGLLSVLAKD